MKLYHGSNVEIDVIDLKKGRRGKDFGQGFYLSDDLQQAREMANTVVDREECGTPIVTAFEFDESLLATDAIDFKKFEHYSTEWGRFVRANRKNRTSEQLHSHDIVYGPIADDTIAKQMRRIDLNTEVSHPRIFLNANFRKLDVNYRKYFHPDGILHKTEKHLKKKYFRKFTLNSR